MTKWRRGLQCLPGVLATLLVGACDWISLAVNSLTYGEVQRGEVANLAVHDSVAFATLAEDGLEIVDIRSGRTMDTVPPPAGSESVDDIAISGDLAFVLDARAPGHLSVLSFRDPLHPRLISPPREVPVGPFSGVSANAGRCVVSGGTSALTLWHYDSAGVLTGPIATGDLGRGQPDVLVGTDGRTAFVSTHYRGPYFGLDVLGLDQSGPSLTALAELRIDGAGFTTGGSKPANFPVEMATLGQDSVLVAYGQGVAVIGRTTTGQAQLLERIDVGGPAVNIDVLGTNAVVAVAGRHPALVLLAFSGGQARIVKRYPLPAGARPAGVALTTTRVAVAARERGVLVFER